ncbi:hypothetical protein C8R45DRAFT_1105936 [Mycena sanguinolenta]|nr:hypothetical protein C8R45DRAFT_1105936 [Mycena sanguinolenta]
MATACPEDRTPVIQADDIGKLEENSRVVEKLEDVYSLLVKDPTSKTTLLTPDESCRFHWAMYRIMLHCTIFFGPYTCK